MNRFSSRIVRWIDAMRAHIALMKALVFGALGLFVVFDVFAPRHEAHFAGDNVRGFWALFGLIGCVLMARFMKGIGHAWLMQPEDFYRKGEE